MASLEVSYESTDHSYQQLDTMEASYEPDYPQVLTVGSFAGLL